MALTLNPTGFDLGQAGTSTTSSLTTDLASEVWTSMVQPAGISWTPANGTAVTGTPTTITFTLDRALAGPSGATALEFNGTGNIATFTLTWSSPPPPVFGGGLSFQGELNRLAKTFGFGPARAARLWVGGACPEYDTQGCLNWKQFGEDRTQWLEIQGICNLLAGTTGLGAQAALAKIATPA